MELNITEQKQQKKKTLRLLKYTGSCNYKIVIPARVEKKIRFLCNQIHTIEWSGVLFYTYSGTFENNDLVITCEDLYTMDIGTATYTEYDMNNPDVIAYIADNPELIECQIGLIH